MKKYEAIIVNHGGSYFDFRIFISGNVDIENILTYSKRDYAKRAAERVAKKLGIGLIWTK